MFGPIEECIPSGRIALDGNSTWPVDQRADMEIDNTSEHHVNMARMYNISAQSCLLLLETDGLMLIEQCEEIGVLWYGRLHW